MLGAGVAGTSRTLACDWSPWMRAMASVSFSMTWDQAAILTVLAGTLAVFVWDRWRYDVVAVTSLMACVLLGLIAPDDAFAGFSNPAVITARDQPRADQDRRDRRARRPADRSERRPGCPSPDLLPAGRAALGLHEQHRRARAADADRAVDRAPAPLRAGPPLDAAVVRDAAGRHDDADRHAAEPADLGLPRRGDRRALPAVRLRADRACADPRGHRLPAHDRLAPARRSPGRRATMPSRSRTTSPRRASARAPRPSASRSQTTRPAATSRCWASCAPAAGGSAACPSSCSRPTGWRRSSATGAREPRHRQLAARRRHERDPA